MPTRKDSRDELSDIGEVVAPLNMCPLVNDDAIEFVGRELLNENRRNGDNRRPATNHGRTMDTARDHQLGGAPVLFQLAPMVKATFERHGKGV